MGTFSCRIQPVNRGFGIKANVNAAHKVMLTGEYGYSLFCYIYSLVKTFLIYHRKAFYYKTGAFVSYIQIEIFAVCFYGFPYDSLTYDISGGELSTFIIVMCEAFSEAVEQYGTLTTYCFAYKEAFPVFFCGESGRVKLYSVEVHKLSSQLAGECYAVTCSDGTVCCVFVDTSYSARSKQAIAA